MDERWDTHQRAYLDHLARERHDFPILALHPPLRRGAWNLPPEETLVRSGQVWPAPSGRRSSWRIPRRPEDRCRRWAEGPLREARSLGVTVAVENMPRVEAPAGSSASGAHRICYLPEHLVGLGAVTLDTSHVGASRVDLMRAHATLADQLGHVHLSDSDLTGWRPASPAG